MRESEVEKYLVERVKALGGECRKVEWVGRRGAPDRLVMVPPQYAGFGRPNPARTIWVELKAPGEKPKPHQVREHQRMRDMGQRVVVIDHLEGVDVMLGGA